MEHCFSLIKRSLMSAIPACMPLAEKAVLGQMLLIIMLR